MDEDHWATIRNAFLLWQGGWDIDPVFDGLTGGPTVVVHGHTPALRVHAKTKANLEPMDGINDFRSVCLDAGAAYKPQLGWARFWLDDGRSQVSIHVTIRPEARG
jgi:serine/threonine protein phosphatase 1